MDAIGNPRIILAHDWLTGMRGGEKCLESLCRRWPDAHLYTLLHKPGSVSPAIEALPRRTSILNRLPRVAQYYRYLLPVMPAIVDAWQVPACDLVVSFSHCVAKGLRPPEGVPHVCYCFTPMRYAWHMRDAYFGAAKSLKDRARDWLLGRIREWDRASADRVTHFIAISHTIKQRIAECYGRPATVIYPPVDTDFYCPSHEPREDFYLAVSAFAPYKRLDLAVAACRLLKKKLVVIGSGQDETKLRKKADDGVTFLGWQSDEVIRDHMRRCKALLFPGEEDFGIVPVEAMGCGAPVIAYGRGGATETVVPPGRGEPTGLWFEEQTVDGLASALESFEKLASDFEPAAARRQALRFHQGRFVGELFGFLDHVMAPTAARSAA